ncbi:MAG: TetR/AcrR family transcriptional regulator [bacterium]
MTRATMAPRRFHVPGLFAPDDPPSKQRVLEAALELFVERGVAETSVRDIGARAGYSNPVIFKYFADKDELAAHVFFACYRAIAEILAPAVSDDRGYRENVHALCQAFGQVLEEHLTAFLYMFENVRRYWPRTSPALRRLSLLAVARRLVQQGKADGVVASDADVEMLVAAYAGLFGQVARMRYFGSFSDRSTEWASSMERLFLAMGR